MAESLRLLVLADASSVHTARWTQWFAERGHEVMLASLEQPGDLKVPFYPLAESGRSRWYEYLAAVPRLLALLRQFRPQLVNAHFVPNYGFMGALSGFHPLAVSCWGSDLLVSPKKSWRHHLRVRLSLKAADVVTGDGAVLVREIVKMGVAGHRVHNIPMGIEEKLISGRPRPKKKQNLVLISTRSLEPIYDVATLIRALPLIAGRRPGIRLKVAGSGSQESILRKLADSLGISSRIDFLGRLPHGRIFQELDGADIYISCSLSDSTSVSLLEAMARGLVPVVSDIPGNREWIRDGENGYLFQTGDHRQLARIVDHLCHAWDGQSRIIAANRKLLEARACWQQNMARVESLFLDLIK